FFSSRRRHTRFSRDWSSDVCSSDLLLRIIEGYAARLALDRWSNVAVISVRRPAGLVTASPAEEHGLAFLAASLRFVNGPFFVWVDRSIKRSGVALGTCRIDPRGGLSPELHAHADNLEIGRAHVCTPVT